MIKPRQGQDLWTDNAHEDSRRIVLNKVAHDTSYDDLLMAIESYIGSVKRMYRYEPEDPNNATKKKSVYGIVDLIIESRDFGVMWQRKQNLKKAENIL